MTQSYCLFFCTFSLLFFLCVCFSPEPVQTVCQSLSARDYASVFFFCLLLTKRVFRVNLIATCFTSFFLKLILMISALYLLYPLFSYNDAPNVEVTAYCGNDDLLINALLNRSFPLLHRRSLLNLRYLQIMTVPLPPDLTPCFFAFFILCLPLIPFFVAMVCFFDPLVETSSQVHASSSL